ncbi:MAG: hypothetical protein KAI43_05390 [Candidatus Aureabacteria bacterium]|nr:hypothetical protein [Candidatus Auribacterota bacterium]
MELGEINNYIIERKCPGCNNHLRILLNDIILEKIIVCATCHAEVKPVDAETIARDAKEELDAITRKVQGLLTNIKFEVINNPHSD